MDSFTSQKQQAPLPLRVMGFGESMIRLAPHPTYMAEGEAMYGRGNPSGNAPYLRSIGGDELNVMVAHARLGNFSEWVSVVSRGPNGDYIINAASDEGVSVTNCERPKGQTDTGVFWVIPTEKRVLYQRKYSAFWQEDIEFNWGEIFSKPSVTQTIRLHATGITPMCGPIAKRNWEQMMAVAQKMDIPITMDLNHRPALGPLSTLWDITLPFVSKLHHLVLAKDSVLGLGKLLLNRPAEPAPASVPEWNELLQRLQQAMGGNDGPTLLCCFKCESSGEQNQKRWSTAITPQGTIVTTEGKAVFHTPKEPCGGGSCFAAGLIDGCYAELGLADAMHRGDCLAALCQETMGDWSIIDRPMLTRAEEWNENGGHLIVRNLDQFRSDPPKPRDTKTLLGRAVFLSISVLAMVVTAFK